MKKVVFGLMILLMMAFQCESPEEEYGPEGHWYIKNQQIIYSESQFPVPEGW